MTPLPLWSAGTQPATLKAPPLSVDCHHHIYDNRFPYDSGTSLRPADATVTQYQKLQQRLGIFRSVVVQPSSYGTDNSCLVDALRQIGKAAARGVAVIDERTPDADIQTMHDVGVRGIRFNLSRPAGANIDQLDALAWRVAPFGWHVQVHTLGHGYLHLEKHLERLPVPVVIDHLGRVPQPDGTDHEVFTVLRRLVDSGRTWIKLSGAYHDSIDGAPTYADTGRMVTEWLAYAPERVVWGTDWPHPAAMIGEKPMPDDARLLDLLGEWAPNPEVISKVLVENPIVLYGFSSEQEGR